MISLTYSDWTSFEVVLLLLVLCVLAIGGTLMAIPWVQEVRYRRMLEKRLESMHKKSA